MAAVAYHESETMRVLVGLMVGAIVGRLAGWGIGYLICPGSPLPADTLDSVMSFLAQFGGFGVGSLLGFILGGGLASRSSRDEQTAR